MTTLFDMHGYDTDKGPMYRRVYDSLFSALRDEPVKLLELGVFRGGSLLMWRDYFERGTIVGLDVESVTIDDPSGRIRIYRGEQQDPAILDRIAAECAPDGFDVIIDDASHVGELTRLSFWHLFERHLKPGGTFVVEDWGTAYWPDWPDGRSWEEPKAVGAPGTLRREFPSHQAGMVGFLKQLVDECAMGEITFPGRGKGPARAPRIESVCFSPGQCVIRKPV